MARPFRNGWQADVQVPGHGRLRKVFKTQREAEAFERSPMPGVVLDKRRISVVFPEIAKSIWTGTPDERNVLRIADELVRRLGKDRLVNTITDLVVDELTVELEEAGNKPSTINSKLTRLSKILKRARKLRLIDAVPEIELKKGIRNNRIRYFTKDEEQAILSALPEHTRQMARFMLYTGCRFSEAQKLLWKDVLPDDVVFWDTKSGRSRSVTQTAQAKAALQWGIDRKLQKPFDIPYPTFRNHWANARKKAKLDTDPHCVPHVLRHTCASRLAMSGVHVTRIQQWMGHETLAMTQRYMHLAPKAMDDVAKALEAA